MRVYASGSRVHASRFRVHLETEIELFFFVSVVVGFVHGAGKLEPPHRKDQRTPDLPAPERPTNINFGVGHET